MDNQQAEMVAGLLKEQASHLYSNNATSWADVYHGLARKVADEYDLDWKSLPDRGAAFERYWGGGDD